MVEDGETNPLQPLAFENTFTKYLKKESFESMFSNLFAEGGVSYDNFFVCRKTAF